MRYEVQVRYNNGDRVAGNFADKSTAIDFLRSYAATDKAGDVTRRGNTARV